MSKDYYKILGVDKSSTQDEIKKSYRKKAMQYHPDKNPGDKQSEEKFKECAEAFEVLSDPQKKQQYDQFGSVGGGNFNSNRGHGFSMDDIFSQFGDIFGFGGFGNSQKTKKRGSDLRIKVEITLDEVISGADKKIKYSRQTKCDTCDGSGGENTTNCALCNGSGYRSIVQQTPFGVIRQSIQCQGCRGEGKTIKDPCKKCNGSGSSTSQEIIDIKIPKGSVNGTYMSVPGYGNWHKGGEFGDLQIIIEEIPDDNFVRDENNLIYEQEISIIDAILGKEFKIKSPTGNISFTVQPGTQHGKVIRIPGKGVPIYNLDTGDLYIKISIRIPKTINKEQRDILNSLKEYDNFK